MSALKHGFFKAGFMLCDRCVLNVRCESFVPASECSVEKKGYDLLVSELIRQYNLEGLADEIMVQRLAMYLIRIARAEAYEANVGFSDASVAWGKYIAGLDENVRGLMRELTISRAQRQRVEKDDVMVDLDQLMVRLNKSARIFRRCSPREYVLRSWTKYKMRLRHERRTRWRDAET